jgi:DNA glycosylase AlkZ-like
MPRAALLSIHARVEGTQPGTWEDPSLVQVWGPRFSAFVIAVEDRSVFTLGRSPYEPGRRQRGEGMADRLEALLGGRRMSYADAGHALGVDPNMLRYAAPTGRVLIRWDGARRPDIWVVAAPNVDPEEARRELVSRYLHAFGPGTPSGFAEWAGLRAPRALTGFNAIADLMTPVRTPVGDGWILTSDEPSFLAARSAPADAVRLLPSGDAYFLCWGADRELLVPDAARRGELWTSRVWPGAVLASGEIVGIWRRADANVTVRPWRRVTTAERAGTEAEAASLPLPGLEGSIRVRWEE